MADMMTFPETWEEFEKSYGFVDDEEAYTNGSRLIPSFRVKQWLDHIAHLESKRQATVSSDCIFRQDAIEAVCTEIMSITDYPLTMAYEIAEKAIECMPSAQPEPERGFWYPIQRGEQGYSAGDFRCSVCGQPNHCSHVTKYCCNCGAKMER